MTSRLERLVPELLDHTLNMVDPRDLVNLCTTCRTIHAAVLPVLYHRMRLSPTTPGWPFGDDRVALLRRSNPGMRFVRRLQVTPGADSHTFPHPSRINDPATVLTVVKRLLRCIPQNILESLYA